jgi:bleomycin hydrolase
MRPRHSRFEQVQVAGARRHLGYAVAKLGINEPALNMRVLTEIPESWRAYHRVVPMAGTKVTNQHGAGLCWAYAGLNQVRKVLACKMGVPNLELSPVFLLFHDKAERSEVFLRRVLELACVPLECSEAGAARPGADGCNPFRSREVEVLLKDPLQGDGGYANYFFNLVERYGVVPLSAMPYTFSAKRPTQMNNLLHAVLRAAAVRLRALVSPHAHLVGKSAGSTSLKQATGRAKSGQLGALQGAIGNGAAARLSPLPGSVRRAVLAEYSTTIKTIRRILTDALGDPPTVLRSVQWACAPVKTACTAKGRQGVQARTRSTSGEGAPTRDLGLKQWGPLTPQQLYAKSDLHFDDMVTLVADPRRQSRDHLRMLTVNRINVVSRPGDEKAGGGGPPFPTEALNVTNAEMQQAAQATLEAGTQVWVGCDVGQQSHTQHGVMDPDLYDFEAAYGADTRMSREDAVRVFAGGATHAMLVGGLHYAPAGASTKKRTVDGWLIQNSWGTQNQSRGGWLHMSNNWWGLHVYEIVVPRRFAPNGGKPARQERIVLDAWDPLFYGQLHLAGSAQATANAALWTDSP